MIVTLIGYRGTGKSSVAPALSQRLGWDWVDADVELEQRAGRTIRDIFAAGGEPEFRRLERENLVDLLKRDRLVLAAGGGAILNPDTRRDLKAAGPVVWLAASVETIADRLLADPATASQRPALTTRSPADEIADLLKLREPLYRDTATVMLSTDCRDISDIVDEIVNRLPAEIAASARRLGERS